MTASEQLDGLAFVEGVRDGRWPADPFMVALGIRVTAAERGRCVMEATPGDDHRNLGGIVHGGYLSTLLDSVTGFALHTTLKPGDTPPHLSASYRFLSMARPGVALVASAEVLKAGRSIGHVRAELRDAAGRLVATGETTHAVVAAPAAEPPSR